MSGAPEGGRPEDLSRRLAQVRSRISAASHAANSSEPRLIVVTKYFPASDVRILAGLGVSDVGENRDQEAAAKAAELEDLSLAWHFIGQLQSNKARSVVRYARSVHSVDRVSLVTALGKAVAVEQERRGGAGSEPRPDLDCYLQFSLDPDGTADGRGGALPADAAGLAEKVAGTAGLRLAGVMAVAPVDASPDEAFARLLMISAAVRAVDPSATGVSAGMSGDLEAAVAAGATHLRIGSDVLGPRPAVG
ncbi:YggS family pyridoxal phosphate-dependent enzyme [Arthrobacter agilis]|uniref:YggS family pyridoxal phosphate-dependent enzyme n=1 Tax=Arthrobacter agilis TaxID=37921 RepID=UPI000B352B81|nr:YggS family pyridoxal phosphate-dependent enzyme [Arthrobacter agilis]OUM45396.1 YggS family pyridoxal phosphate enzyme [Arthrobacter agilis]PPB46976.1 YggS family pyridoxal phosphate-dependent enzyme [Arthrobacter agilis]TPV23430.1 YggS family pyridoxal phosphate-dependent enzyme [Arthrobacter agilis]VDR31812.1 Predicted enzyme with a TIM-barrel fold [Arthrobacter agilis]